MNIVFNMLSAIGIITVVMVLWNLALSLLDIERRIRRDAMRYREQKRKEKA